MLAVLLHMAQAMRLRRVRSTKLLTLAAQLPNAMDQAFDRPAPRNVVLMRWRSELLPWDESATDAHHTGHHDGRVIVRRLRSSHMSRRTCA
ncbi:hypothetical protein DOTSEDRAFT_75762 [Dothistroma septosporum NZE10]|uniref:Uncharacterized protein n=1 Tax=Dothistroma septosporum (strain NZE10 / CBS 128990) TaxID=675120 RepID=N1PBP0_DOTSN|nr:hypothetical protein DOTSEDRAFT_75762 [Dothistroma septosporum NZE10]